ncbi:16S rRNA (guanine(527)-N(7))-methyltransferase RsmG [Pelagivirga sediminicola]|uniref:16S rRNA (guanine(527)-N(7))-methyltransferase RsmG n=1 Tax=Pelagivirga sediminicola TaxID=2170575 RepID=UPI00311AB1F8
MANVSRETIEQLRAFETLICKWSPTINLVSRADRKSVWERHILDSVQLYDAAPRSFTHWVDLGSGGGFPAVVVAILANAANAPRKITMVESDSRKATFLRTALREIGVPGIVINERIEDIPSLSADIISARALASLDGLLTLAQPHLTPTGTCLFAKGAKWRSEVEEAKLTWKFACSATKSDLDPEAAILSIKELSRA